MGKTGRQSHVQCLTREALINAAIGSFCWLSERFSCQSRQPQRWAGADGLMSSGGRKCPAGEIQVCERQQREHLSPILGDTAIAHLSIAELALHDTKHMLDFRAHLAEPIIAGTLAGRSLPPGLAFSFTAQSTPVASAARFFASLA